MKAILKELVVAAKHLPYLPFVFVSNSDRYPIETMTFKAYAKLAFEVLFPSPTSRSTESVAEVTIGSGTDEDWYFVNGICTTLELAEENARALSQIFKRKIYVLHNPTDGLLSDLYECMLGRTLNMKQNISYTLALPIALSLSKGRKVKLIGHSQGGIISSNIVKIIASYFNANTLRNFELYTFAGAQDELPDVVYAEHFCNEWDYVSRIGAIEYWPNISGSVFVRPKTTGHLLNSHYLANFKNGDYCGKTSRLFGYIPKDT